MTDHALTVTLPDYIYVHIRQAAAKSAQPVEDIVRERLTAIFALSEPLPALADDEEAELSAFRHLSDDTLWTIAREQMSAIDQTQLEMLMDGNSMGKLTTEESAALAQLVERGQRLMLCKAEAAGLLTERGHKITSKDLARGHAG